MSFIRRARDRGFALDRTRALFGPADARDKNCREVYTIAQDHLNDDDRKNAELKDLRTKLYDLIGQCQRGITADGRVIGGLLSFEQ
jgi:DNA-binding transcriptional MerR regulator